jgi:hypothetical protein
MQRVGSREYKMMLRAARFAGEGEAPAQAAAGFWKAVAGAVLPHAISVSGLDGLIRRKRRVRFFDNAAHGLRARNYVLRERIDQDSQEREVTLKFRHPDRYVSQDRDMTPADGHEADVKFEEDIKPPFSALFSFSSSVLIPQDLSLATFGDAAKLFPGLAKAVDDLPEDDALDVVGGFTAFERVIKGTGFHIRRDPEVHADCALTLWYTGEGDTRPLLAEFSFKYEDADEAYTGKMTRRAYDAFVAMQRELTDWIDTESDTKTAFVYRTAT